MDDRRTTIALFLCIMVVLVYSELFISPMTRQAQQGKPVESTVPAATGQPQLTQAGPAAKGPGAPVAGVQSAPPVVSSGQAAQASAVSYATPADIEKSGKIRIEGPLFTTEISLLGGRLTSFKLRNFAEKLGDSTLHELIPVNPDNLAQPLPLGVYTDTAYDGLSLYSLVQTSTKGSSDNAYVITPGSELILTFSTKLNDGSELQKIFRFQADSYLFDLRIKQLNGPQPPSALWLEWAHFTHQLVDNQRLNPEDFTFLGTDNKIKKIMVPALTEPEQAEGSNSWAAFGDKYFMSAVVMDPIGINTIAGRGVLKKDGESTGNVYFLRLKGAQGSAEFKIYAGPKDDKILGQLGYQLHRSIDLGFFSFLAYPLLWAIRFFNSLLGNYGLAIILLTLLIKGLFLPLTKASFESARAMQDIQPEMKALRERIKDPTQLNQEMAALFKKRGVNPVGGCLPILPQIPVFFGLYSALLHSIELRHAPFALWVRDLSVPEFLPVFGVHIPVMILIMGASMFVQQKMMPAPPDPMQRKIMSFFPLMFAVMFIIFPLPSGLVLYMLVNNAISITQQAYLRSDRKASPLTGTLIASVAIFGLGYILTLL